MHLAVPIYLAGVLLLIAVALFGDVSKGARRWLNLGFMRVQPSELMKIAMPLLLAWYFQQREAMPRLRDYGVAAALLLLPVALIARQPDLGTAILVLAAGFYVIFFAGLSWKIMIGMAAAALAAAPLAWNLLHDYQRNRIITLFDPEKDPLGKGFHIIQSTIAIGSGGIFGKGWREGTQAQLEFIPERHTDFIFAVFSEEFGLLRQPRAAGALCAADRTRADDRRQRGDAVLAPAGRCRDHDLLHLCLREHGHGFRHPARGRRAAAADQLRRHGAGDAVHRHRHPDVDPRQPHAGAEVSRNQGSSVAPLLCRPILLLLAACGTQAPRRVEGRGDGPPTAVSPAPTFAAMARRPRRRP
jgi:hypothetical protein